MKFLGLLLLGAIDGGIAYLLRTPQSREAVRDLGSAAMETGMALVPVKYLDMASRIPLVRRKSPYERMEDVGLVVPEEDAGNRPGGPIEPAQS
jgi:hypothetical protein